MSALASSASLTMLIFSVSTSIRHVKGADARAALTAFPMPPAALMWLSLSIMQSDKLKR